MKADNYTDLEKNIKFKKKYIPTGFWFRQAAIYPPVIILFMALFGLVYLLNYDMLISYYALPFVVLFILGTVWLKSVRRYILNNKLTDKGSFMVCLAALCTERDGRLYFVFSTSEKRHNRYFIQNIAKNISDDDLLIYVAGKNVNSSSVPLYNDDIDRVDEIYVRSFKESQVNKYNISWKNNGLMPVIYLDKAIILVKQKDVNLT